MSSNRNSSNVAAFGTELVAKLNSANICVCGNNLVSESLVYNLIGLGVGSIEHITYSDKLQGGILHTLARSLSPNPYSLRESLTYIAPQIKYTQVKEPDSAKFIVDTQRLKIYSLENFTNVQEEKERSLNPRKKEYSQPYAIETSLLYGALLANEFRKKIGLVAKYEQSLPLDEAQQINLPFILHDNAARLTPRNYNRVLIIGAGGLGTHCAYILAQRGAKEIIICDYDVAEEKNLNRQLFYTGCVGESKAVTLSQRLSEGLQNKNTTLIAHNRAFSNDFNSQAKIDAIFCCTDTLESRIIVSDYAQNKKIPLVEGACTPTMGSVTTYFPGKSAPISIQRDLIELLRLHKNSDAQRATENQNNSCAQVSNPSIIVPNVIIGGLQAIALDNKLDVTKSSVEAFPQIYFNSLTNKKFSHGGL